MDKSTNHHYLPIFYSKRWCNDLGKLHCYKRINGNVKESTLAPKRTGYEPDLYSTNMLTSSVIEDEHFKSVDNNAAIALKKIIEDPEILKPQEKHSFSRFIRSLLTRHEAHLKYAREKFSSMLESKLKHLSEINKKILFADPEFESFCNDIPTQTIAALSGYKTPYNVDLSSKHEDFLMELDWIVISFDKIKDNLLTCDYPVSMIRTGGYSKTKGNKKSISEMLFSGEYCLSLPLSPKHCFYAGKYQHKTLTEPTTNDLKEILTCQNLYTLGSAKNRVYAEDNSLSDFIRNQWLI